MASKRLHREYQDILRNPVYLWETYPSEMNIYQWSAILTGHPDSPYAGKTFCAEIIFSENYPFHPPHFKFITRINHPNVSPTGIICIDILKQGAWSPAYTVSALLLSIGSLIFEKPLIRLGPRLTGQ